MVKDFKKIEKELKKLKSKKTKTKKLFKKPKKTIKEISATKLIKQMGKEQGVLVREVENKYADPVQDNRSQFFRESFAYEKKKTFGGFI